MFLVVPATASADNQLPHAVVGPPPADYRVNSPACLAGAASNDSDGQIVDYAWEYGDGKSSAGTNASPCHTYTASGWYVVKLVVTDNQGAIGWTSMRVYVHSLAPAASFVDSVTHNAQERRFDGSKSSDPDGGIVKYDWRFGDGTVGFGQATVHRYSSPGTYTVTLTVTDNSGDTATFEQNVTIALSPPTVTIGGSPQRCADERYNLEVDAADSDGHIADIRWDLDDKSGYELDTYARTTAGALFSAGSHHVAAQVMDDSGLVTEAVADFVFRSCKPTLQAPRALRVSASSVRVAVSCLRACAADAELDAGGVPVGTGTAKLAAAGTTNVRIKLGAAAKRRLKRQRRAGLLVQVTEASGLVTTLKKQIPLRKSRRAGTLIRACVAFCPRPSPR